MGLFDRFKPQHEQKKEKKVRHAVDANAQKEAAFAAVGSAGKTSDKVEKSDKAVEAKPKRVARDDTRQAFRVLVRPMVTEKSTQLRAQNRYAFAVHRQATKLSVKDAVLALYGVRPIDVTIQNFDGKFVRYGRSVGRTKAWKRAIVTLPAGKTIDVSEV
jgi:large subunit ribosomal protein L23